MNFEQPNPSASVVETRLLEHLHQRLTATAAEEGLTDVVYRIVQSPVGSLLLGATGQGLVRVAFESEIHEKVLDQLSERIGSRILRAEGQLEPIVRQLDEYFSGTRQSFDLALDLRLSTHFRRDVQQELQNIGYGQTLSYLQVAERIGKPRAVRAVGSACATNPLPIVLPCHRVLRTDGSLGGYLGGLAAKRALLHLENPAAELGTDVLF